MTFLANMKVGTRLGLGFAAMIVLILAITSIGTLQMSAINDATDLIVRDRAVKVTTLYGISNDVNKIARSIRNMVIFTDDTTVRTELASVIKARADVIAASDGLKAVIANATGKADLRALLEARDAFIASLDEFDDAVNSGHRDVAKTLLMTKARPLQLALIQSIETLISFQQGLMQESAKEATDRYHDARALMFTIAAAAALVATALGAYLGRSVTRPLRQALSVAQRVASGDLGATVAVHAHDETGLLLDALGTMNANLSTMVGTVRRGTDSIAIASKQIASGNADLSERTEQQAASLEQTAASMEQLTATVTQNAENARQANQLAMGASDVARRGGAVVGQVVTTMSSINQSSKKVVDIISVIDGIAFQTNILALNAAVEAARAGEQGRGFAVVAAEVRTLAQRSAAAAKEIKELISDSVGKVENGTRLVDEAGKTMEEIVDSVRRVTDIMAEITAASQEQSAGINQVNTAVAQMDEVTQQNAALVEESAAAATSMQEQAQRLAQGMSVFKLVQATDPVEPAPVTVARPLAEVHRLKPVARKPARAVAASPAAEATALVRTGTDDEWAEF